MGIKEPPSIKTKAVARQSSKWACNVIVGRRLFAFDFYQKQSPCLIGLGWAPGLKQIWWSIPGFLACGFIGQPVQLSNLMMKNRDNLSFLQEPLFITSCRALAPPCGASHFLFVMCFLLQACRMIVYAWKYCKIF